MNKSISELINIVNVQYLKHEEFEELYKHISCMAPNKKPLSINNIMYLIFIKGLRAHL